MTKEERKQRALQDLIKAARDVREVNNRQREGLRHIQALAAEARRTGENLTHRIRPVAYDYGDSILDLLDALDRYEKNEGKKP